MTERPKQRSASKFLKTARLLSGVFAGQGSVQLLLALSGFLLIRWMSVTSYAQYTITFGFVATLSLVVDLGFANAVIALVGPRIDDPAIVGGFISAGRRIRNQLMSVALPMGAGLFVITTNRQHWGLRTQVALYATVVVSVVARGLFDYYQLPLLMHRRYREYYGPQVAAGVGRLAATVVAWATGAMTAIVASLINAAVLLANGSSFRRRVASRPFERQNVSPHLAREMRHYVAPLVPAIAFAAVQSQMGILVAAVFAHTRSIAQVGALTRLGQLFLIPNALTAVVVGPYVARLGRQRLASGYLRVLRLAAAAGAAVSAACFLWPAVPLLALGSRYSDLTASVGWYVLASTLSYLSSLLYAMNAARRFVYFWASVGGPVLVVLVQGVALATFDASTTLGIQYVLVCTNATLLGLNLMATLWGFGRGPRQRAAGHGEGIVADRPGSG